MRKFKETLKKVFCIALSTVIVSSTSLVALANDRNSAADDANPITFSEFKDIIESGTDINVISEDSDSYQNFVYTYMEDGVEYKVVENANDNLTYVKSDIFVKDGNGDYELESSTITDVQADKIVITKTEDGQVIENVVDLLKMNEEGIKEYNDFARADVSGWTLHYTQYYSYRIYTYTLVSITAVVTGVAGFFTGVTPVVTGAIATIASYILDDHIERVWYEVDVHYKYIPMANDYRYKVAERASEYHFADENRTIYLGVTRSEYWLHPEYQ